MRAGLGPGGVGTLYRLGLISCGRALALVVLAQSVAAGLVGVIDGSAIWPSVASGLAAGVARALLTWVGRVAAARASLGAKEALRAELADRLLGGGSAAVGSTTVLATRGLDELDEYYGSVLPAVMNAAVIPLVVGARILSTDWVSALIVVLTVPLIPVFMALVGLHTRDRVAAATGALARLSDHLVELARGLPVLVGLGRAPEQTAALARVSDDYRRTTIISLRTAFLSSLVLELLSTISVAVVAVFIGLRLVNGSLPLEVGLLVLILVPECYAPFREVGSAFHAAQNGLAALRNTRAILDAPAPRPVVSPGGGIVLESLAIHYAEHTTPIVDRLTAVIPRRRVTALLGASGSGKSSVLAALAGRLANGTDGASVSGRVLGVDLARVAWLPQHPVAVEETVNAELRLYGEGIPSELLESRIAEVAARLGFAALLREDPARLSPGELRRVAFARVLLRVDAGAELVLLDEPTAHLDEGSASAVRSEIGALAGNVTVVLASHDPLVNGLATASIVLGDASLDPSSPSASPLPAAPRVAEDSDVRRARDIQIQAPTRPTLRMLLAFLAPSRGRFIGALALGSAASLFAISLTAVSGWLIVRASEHPAIMYLLVAIVGVRFFGIGRSVLRYGEQLAAHDAIFRSTGELRLRVWRAIASRGAASRGLLAGGSTVDNLVVTTDRIRDLVPRVVSPAIIGVIVSVAVTIAVGLLFPAALPLIVAMLVVSLAVAPAVAIRAERRAGIERAALGSRVARRFAALIAAAPDLRANGVDAPVRAELAALDSAAGVRARRGARALGAGHAIVVFACCATAMLMLPAAVPSVANGTLAGEIVAVLVLLPLALLEPLLAVVSALQQWPTLAASLAAADGVTSSALEQPDAPQPAMTGAQLSAVTELALVDLAARWPGASAPTFEHLTATASRGDWLVVHGPSGSGKSTLLTVLLGYLRPAAGSYELDGCDSRTIPSDELHARLAWSPQEGHLFDSTIRANLLLARPRHDAPTDAELHGVLRRVGLTRLVESLPDGIDSRVGRQGSHLSGGERQRLSVARALLTRADILLLDEPTAHLDEATATAMMADLRTATADQLVVLVTHRPADSRPDDLLLELAPLRVRALDA